MSFGELYDHRFDSAERAEKARLWRTLCRSFFQRYTRPDDTGRDVGTGFCEFVNSVHCRRLRFTHGVYWDFFDHHLPLTDRSLVEALLQAGLCRVEVRPRFLPYTTKSRLPKWSRLVRTYLSFPFLHRMFGKQAWIVAVKS